MSKRKGFFKRTFINTVVIITIYFLLFNTSLVLVVVGFQRNNNLLIALSSLSLVLTSIALSLIMTISTDRKQKKFMQVINDQFERMAEGDFSMHINTKVQEGTTAYEIVDNINKLNDELAKVSVLKKDFIKNFSHEFKTPIASIKGFSGLLVQGGLSKEEEDEYHKIILEESTRLSNLAQSTLMLSKLESSTLVIEKEDYQFNEQIEECSLLLYKSFQSKHQELEVELPRIVIHANKDLMKEVIINLLSNANKYTGDGGKIEVSYKEDDDNHIISFKDNGLGISKSDISHIFEDYFQADQSRIGKGIGLGLSIVKKVLDVHNYRIEVESEEGKGSVFNIIIPK